MRRLLLFAFAGSGAVFVAIDPLHFFRDVVCHVAAVVLVMTLGISDYLRKLITGGQPRVEGPTEPEKDGL